MGLSRKEELMCVEHAIKMGAVIAGEEPCPYCKIAEQEKEIEFLDKCRKTLEGLTPGGSEYFRDPEFCASVIRDRFKQGHEAKKELAMLRKARR
jgi:hypothetical protein